VTSTKLRLVLVSTILFLIMFLLLPLPIPLTYESDTYPNGFHALHSELGYPSSSLLVSGFGLMYFVPAHWANFYVSSPRWENLDNDSAYAITRSFCQP
jgi:hypothetical protein